MASNLTDGARVQDGSPAKPVSLPRGAQYAGPVWKDAAGCFVIHANERVAVRFVLSRGQWLAD